MSIPSWQMSELQQLASANELSGLPPSTLASIDQAESGGEVAGAGINPEGYGGYFGLGAGDSYPAGSIPASTLETNSATSFAQQAVVAASSLASDIKQAGGNMAAAIGTFDGAGPSGGRDYQVYLGNGGTPTGSASPGTATETALNMDPLDLFGVPQTIFGALGNAAGSATGDAFSALWKDVGPFIVKSILVIAGLSMTVVGAIKLVSPGKSARQIAANFPQTTTSPAASSKSAGAAASPVDDLAVAA